MDDYGSIKEMIKSGWYDGVVIKELFQAVLDSKDYADFIKAEKEILEKWAKKHNELMEKVNGEKVVIEGKIVYEKICLNCMYGVSYFYGTPLACIKNGFPEITRCTGTCDQWKLSFEIRKRALKEIGG